MWTKVGNETDFSKSLRPWQRHDDMAGIEPKTVQQGFFRGRIVKHWKKKMKEQSKQPLIVRKGRLSELEKQRQHWIAHSFRPEIEA